MPKKILIVVIVAVAVVIATAAVVIINTFPDATTSAASHISLAENYLLDLNHEAAIAEYRMAIQIDPKNADFYIALAEVYAQMGDTKTAVAVLEEGLSAVDEVDKERIRTVLERLVPKKLENTKAETITAVENIDITDKFPDPNFRSAIREELRIGKNDPIMSREVSEVQAIILDGDLNENAEGWIGLGIKNLSGIEYFTSLATLSCGYNQLTVLPELPDSLMYLYCGNNQITSLPELPNSLIELTFYSNDGLHSSNIIFKDGSSLLDHETEGMYEYYAYTYYKRT
jgi:Leucine-rich repeat (LRR) protein